MCLNKDWIDRSPPSQISFEIPSTHSTWWILTIFKIIHRELFSLGHPVDHVKTLGHPIHLTFFNIDVTHQIYLIWGCWFQICHWFFSKLPFKVTTGQSQGHTFAKFQLYVTHCIFSFYCILWEIKCTWNKRFYPQVVICKILNPSHQFCGSYGPKCV